MDSAVGKDGLVLPFVLRATAARCRINIIRNVCNSPIVPATEGRLRNMPNDIGFLMKSNGTLKALIVLDYHGGQSHDLL